MVAPFDTLTRWMPGLESFDVASSTHHTRHRAPAPAPRTPRLCRRANRRTRTRARVRRPSRHSHSSAPSRRLAVRARKWRATTRTSRPLSARGSSRRSAPASVSARVGLCSEACHPLTVSAHCFQTAVDPPCASSPPPSPTRFAAVGMMMLVLFSLYAVGLYFGSTLSASTCGGDAAVGTARLQCANCLQG